MSSREREDQRGKFVGSWESVRRGERIERIGGRIGKLGGSREERIEKIGGSREARIVKIGGRRECR